MSTLSQFLGGNFSGAFDLDIVTDNFSLQSLASDLGSWSSGGHVICKSGGVAWIVASRCAEVSRTWYCRDDTVSVANSCLSPYTGWFVPTCAQLQNPGYTCRVYWDSFSSAAYWSSTEFNATAAWFVGFNSGNAGYYFKTYTRCVRAFRCVTY